MDLVYLYIKWHRFSLFPLGSSNKFNMAAYCHKRAAQRVPFCLSNINYFNVKQNGTLALLFVCLGNPYSLCISPRI
jgi:hypothetical protein